MAIQINVPFYKTAWELNFAIQQNYFLDKILNNAHLCLQSNKHPNGFVIEGEMQASDTKLKMLHSLKAQGSDAHLSNYHKNRAVAYRVTIHASHIDIVNYWVERAQRWEEIKSLARRMQNLDANEDHPNLGAIPRFPPDRKMSINTRQFRTVVRNMPLMKISKVPLDTVKQVFHAQENSILKFPNRPKAPKTD